MYFYNNQNKEIVSYVYRIRNRSGLLFAAHVVVYRGTTDEYDTFITPEAWKAYEEYRNTRIKFGEKITKDSAIMVRRFNVNENGDSNSTGTAITYRKGLGIGIRAIIGILSVVA